MIKDVKKFAFGSSYLYFAEDYKKIQQPKPL
jgi:hypothetical protein